MITFSYNVTKVPDSGYHPASISIPYHAAF